MLLGRPLEPALEDGSLLRVAAQLRRELDDRPPVRDRGGDVRPLPRIGALGEEPAELVERLRMPRQDAVGVLVDEPDLV